MKRRLLSLALAFLMTVPVQALHTQMLLAQDGRALSPAKDSSHHDDDDDSI